MTHRFASFVLPALLLLAAPDQTIAQSLTEATALVESGSHDRARRALEGLLVSDPSAMVRFQYGRLLLAVGQPDSARGQFEQGLAVDPKSGLNTVGLGEVDMAQGRVAEAEDRFDRALRMTRSKDSQVYYHIGLARMNHETRDLPKAVEALARAIEIKSDAALYHLAFGRAHEASGDLNAAVRSYENAVYFDPKLAQAQVGVGSIYFRAGNYSEASRRFQAALAAAPDYAPAHLASAELYFLAKQYPMAVSHYRQFMDLVGPTPERRFTYAGYLYLNKQYAQSLDELQTLGNPPPNPVAYRLLAYTLFETGRAAEGLPHIRSFFASTDSTVWLASDHLYAGRIEIAAGADTLAGIAHLRRAIEADTTNAVLRRDIATLHFGRRSYREAAAEYEAMSVARVPLTGTDRLNLGKSYFFDDHFDRADSAFAEVNRVASGSAIGWLWRARATARMDTSQAAITRAVPHYEQYVTLTTDTARYKRELIEAHSYVAYASYVTGDTARMETHANALLALDPEDEQARALLEAAKPPGND